MNLDKFNKSFLEVTMKMRGIHYPSLHRYAHGECMFYAFVACSVLGAKAFSYVNEKRQDGHCFFKIGNTYYDSETCAGQKDWKNLQPYLKRVRKIKRHNKFETILPKWGLISETHLWTTIAEEVKINYQMDL